MKSIADPFPCYMIFFCIINHVISLGKFFKTFFLEFRIYRIIERFIKIILKSLWILPFLFIPVKIVHVIKFINLLCAVNLKRFFCFIVIAFIEVNSYYANFISFMNNTFPVFICNFLCICINDKKRKYN